MDPSAKTRRQVVLLLVSLNLLVLAIGLVASVDLRRLRTPAGTALRWVEAAVFGDCADYLTYSVADAQAPETRSPEQLCRDLRVSTLTQRTELLRIGLRSGPVVRRGAEATATVVLTRPAGTSTLTVHLVRRGGRWRVLRDAVTCGSVGCA